jgi:phytanoyl-CoA dioxygenase PhyH
MQAMNSVFFDSEVSDDERRGLLYSGQLFVYSQTPGTLSLCNLAREMLEEAFAPYDPREAQYKYSVEDYAKILGEVKPKFIHHPRAKETIQQILIERGCDPEKTYFDVPRLRTSTAQGYLTTGIAFAFHPHRDTWYSAPMCQLNWWMPVYPIEPNNGMAFHPHYWDHPVKNGSDKYNYQDWVNNSRFIAAQQTKADTREQPKPQEEMQLDPQVRVVAPPGGVTIFSAAQMHSSVPNTSQVTRVSIDFRTVHIDDVMNRGGAPNIDSHCTGTTMGDYLRVSDFTHIPENFIEMYM